MTDDLEQGWLQEYGTDVAPPPITDVPPTCERCGVEFDKKFEPDPWSPRSETEKKVDVFDLARGHEPRRLCEDCRRLEWYLAKRHADLVEQPDVTGAVAVFCACQSTDEVDVQAVRADETPADRACSQCGSREIVVEVLPPTGSDHPSSLEQP